MVIAGVQIAMISVNAIIYIIWAGIKAAPGCQKSFPSYKFNSVNFDSEKFSVETLWDHLKYMPKILSQSSSFGNS